MINVTGVPALKDNYIWVLTHPNRSEAIVVDPGEAKPILHYLKEKNLRLIGILVTHHHWDHTNGILELLENSLSQVSVYGNSIESIPGLSFPVNNYLDNSTPIIFSELDIHFNVLSIPGHTKGHVAYLSNQAHLFSGDTLFTAGCGRIFEGSPEQMFQSLTKLKGLPAGTKVYCGHEYTLSNLAFASLVEPENLEVQRRQTEVRQLQKQGIPSVPAPLSVEHQTNPFLRTQLNSVKKSVERQFAQAFDSEILIFSALREWKDHFIPPNSL